jgi:tRNA nucleotidyltransferase/poly(A) polymerase
MKVKQADGRQVQRYRAPLDRAWADVLALVGDFLKKNRAQGYVVGGFIRDMLLGRSSKDLDLAVSRVEPAAVALHLHRELGLSRPVVFPRFKTALTVGKGIEIEVCELQGSLEQDALQRDFTVNCLYREVAGAPWSSPAKKVLDPTGRGFKDLKAGILRTPADPCITLWLDPLRILRAFRLSAVKGFRMAADLKTCIPRLVYLLSGVARERIRAEFEMILLSGRVMSSLRAMQALGVCEMVLPELSRTYGFDQSTPYHDYDLFTHTLKTTASTPADITLRLAALFHDLGKPATRTRKAGRAVYYGHQEISGGLAGGVLDRLRFPGRIRKRVLFLVRNHMIHYSRDWGDKAVRRFVRKMGPHLEDMLLLAEADQKAQSAGSHRDMPVRHLRERINNLMESGGIHLEPPLNGHEIMRVLGIKEGPLVGRAKNMLIEAASARDRAMTRREAVEMLRTWAKRQNAG